MEKFILFFIIASVSLTVLMMIMARLFPGHVFNWAKKIEWARSGLKEKTVDINGLHISYLTGGKGEPLLLLHGFAGGKEHWVWIAKHLSGHFRIISPDMPGCGSSTKDAHLNYSVEEQVKRVYAFSQALGLKSFHISGNSMGGNIASVFAARYPETIISLWLLAPGGVDSAQPSERDILMEKGENVLVAKTAEDFERTYNFCFVNPPAMPGFIKKYLAENIAAGSELVEKIYNDLANQPAPLESALNKLPVPTLILWGDQDRLTHVSGASILESLMPNAKAIVMSDTGHILMMENPESAAKYYLEFQNKM
ncbi:MAG: alpha/beta hydrolase [Desulfobacteraceae bacterium]|nr:alpha/beta hydrolase [Desulfobacteraceae bacterium]